MFAYQAEDTIRSEINKVLKMGGDYHGVKVFDICFSLKHKSYILYFKHRDGWSHTQELLDLSCARKTALYYLDPWRQKEVA